MPGAADPSPPRALGPVVWLGLAALLFAGFAVPYVYLPMAGEQAVISYGAWRLSLGEVLYRDFNCNDAPAIYWIHLAAHRLFGFDMSGLRAFDLVWTGATLAVAHRVAARAFGPLAAGIAVFLAVLSYFSLGYQVTAQKEGFAVLPLLLAVWAAFDLGEGRRSLWLRGVAVGAALGLLFWIKPPLALLGAAFALALPLRPLARWLEGAAAMATGFALPAAAWLGYFGLHGAWVPLEECLVLYNLQYTGVRYGLGEQLAFLARHAVSHPVWIAGLVSPVAVRFGRRQALLAAVTALALAVVLFQGKLLAYHLVPLHLLLCLWAGAGLARLAGRGIAARLVGGAAVGLLLASAAVAVERSPYPRIWSELLAEGAVHAPREEIQVARLVYQYSRPEDPVLVWGVGPAGIISFVSKRETPTRWLMNYPFSALDPDGELVTRWRAEYMEALERRPPTMIVVVGRDRYPGIGNLDSREALERFEALDAYLRRHYRRFRELDGRYSYSIYLRTRPPERAP